MNARVGAQVNETADPSSHIEPVGSGAINAEPRRAEIYEEALYMHGELVHLASAYVSSGNHFFLADGSSGSSGSLGFSVTPNSSLPGSNQVDNFLGGVLWLVTRLCLGALIIGGGLWAFASRSSNWYQSVNGKMIVIAAIGGAIVAGAAPTIINWAFSFGFGFNQGG